MQGYERDPRSLARRAEAYLKSTGIADTAYFGPENEFFIFDDMRWGADISGCFYKMDSSEAGWNSERAYEGSNSAIGPESRAAISRCRRSIPCTTSVPPCAWPWSRRAQGGSASPRSRHRRPVRNRRRLQYPGAQGR